MITSPLKANLDNDQPRLGFYRVDLDLSITSIS